MTPSQIDELRKRIREQAHVNGVFAIGDIKGNELLWLLDALDSERKRAERYREAIEPLIDIAKSYAMQTYDRSGTTRKAIEEAEKALQDGGESATTPPEENTPSESKI